MHLNDNRHLFNTTAYVHGRSGTTTSKKKRLVVRVDNGSSRKRQRGNRGEVRPTNGENGDEIDMTGECFHIEEWPATEFFQFLKSADADIRTLRGRTINSLEFKENFNDKFTSYRENEAVISNCITEKINQFTNYLGGEEEEMTWEHGIKRTYILPGRDNGIDHSFSRTVTQSGGENLCMPPVGVEVKVPWDYPGGKVTSGDVDPGRIGRDVSLVQVATGRPIESWADHSVSRSNDRDDSRLDVTQDTVDGSFNRTRVALRRSPRVQRRPNYSESTPKESENGKYQMKHDFFPPRQIVSYMLSAGLPYAYLTTGYRIDFCMLVVANNTVTLRIAGPFWTVGGLNPYVAKHLRDPQSTDPHIRKKIQTSTTFDHKYYGEIGVQKFGAQNPMRFFEGNGEGNTAGTAMALQDWSTDIGQYSCNEGILRFLLARTGVEIDDSSGKKYARHPVTLPQWYRQYASPKYLQEGSQENMNGGEDNPSSEESDHRDFYLTDDDGSVNYSGQTNFGPLCLADLQDPVRYQYATQPFICCEGDADQIGFGRNGPAFRQKVRGVDLVCKQVAGIGCVLDEIEEQIANLKFEMRCYRLMLSLQGSSVPRFLFAGKLVDTRFWVCPELGHVYGLATSWEGHSLDTKEGADQVKIFLKQGESYPRGQLLGSLKESEANS